MAARTRVPSATIGYERLRVVGKGSFGLAVLYRRLDDDSLVILKQVDLHNLTGAERQLCLNEVSLLSRLDHPHIITYFDSFEEEGVLTIEMEYAEGGTLAQYLAGRECGMEESEIMIMFEQMLSAVLYLHGKNVLHRDLKTANIFLTRLNDIKLGDFGISKAMGTETQAIGASTVVGTPYYISPEMCEGKSYNEKSDIWALGCILYEMAQLQKTFEGTNLPALVNKIMKGQYEQLRGAYSNELKLLIRDMLRKEPESRPSARQALEAVQKRRSVVLRRARADQEISSDTDDRLNKNYSALYFLNVSNMSLSPVNTLPPKLRIRQVAISECHRVVVTSEKLVYSWGDNRHGQLGLGDRRTRSGPCLVEALTGKSISKLAVGSRFSLFCADSGIVMVCGHRRFTGTGKYNEDLLRPRLMESLLSVDIVDISCGEEHAAALGEGGQVFVWGNGANGRLGTGNIEHVLIAVQIETIPIRQISAVFCGSDATALLLIDSATILAMGSNRNNKLSLNRRQGFFTSSRAATVSVDAYRAVQVIGQGEVLDVLQPTSLKSFPSRVIDVRLGRYHSGVLLESGHIHMFGSNESGELGLGHRQVVPCGGGHRPVKTLTSTAWLMFECGDGFTLAASTDNELYFWGSRGPVQDRKDHGLTLLEDLETAIPKQDETIPTATKPSVESNNLR